VEDISTCVAMAPMETIHRPLFFLPEKSPNGFHLNKLRRSVAVCKSIVTDRRQISAKFSQLVTSDDANVGPFEYTGY
jgi:hypothetical protein